MWGKLMREKQKEIQWFLDLINIKDIGRISKKDRAEIADVIFKYTKSQKISENKENKTPGSKFMESLSGLTDPARLGSFQKRVGDFFGFMMWRIECISDIAKKGWIPSEETDFYPHLSADNIKIQPGLRVDGLIFELNTNTRRDTECRFMEGSLIADSDIEPIEITYRQKVDGLKYEPKTKNGRATEYRLIPESVNDAVINTSYDSSMKEGFFLYSFIDLIDGVPITAFKKCPECDKWFINLTKKEKIFCINLCAAKKRQREKRLELKKKIDAGDPEAKKEREIELQKARTRASNSYDKRVKRETPNAKIQKKPRKHHWKEATPPE